MSDNSDNDSTTNAINHIVDKAAAGLDQVTHMLAQHAPQAWELAVKGVYAKGAATLVVGGIFGTVFFLMFISAITFAFLATKRFKEKPNSETGGLFIGITVVSSILCLIFMIGTCANLLDSDSWARIISPDGFLAQQIITNAVSAAKGN